MKVFFSILLALFLLGAGGVQSFAQKRKITVIIFRHAEKETPTEGDETEPDISIEGQKRALRLVKILEKYKPMQIFSTEYARTIQTVTPLSRIKNLPIQVYEPGKMQEFADKLLSFKKNRRIVVVGHNATTVQLVNLLLKQNKYAMPPESEYGKIWIVRIKNGKARDEVFDY